MWHISPPYICLNLLNSLKRLRNHDFLQRTSRVKGPFWTTQPQETRWYLFKFPAAEALKLGNNSKKLNFWPPVSPFPLMKMLFSVCPGCSTLEQWRYLKPTSCCCFIWQLPENDPHVETVLEQRSFVLHPSVQIILSLLIRITGCFWVQRANFLLTC